MDRVPLLVQYEQQIFLDIAVLLLVRWKPAIGNVLQLHLLHELLGAGLLKYLEQALVLGSAQLRFVQIERCSVAVCVSSAPVASAHSLLRPSSGVLMSVSQIASRT